MTREQAIRKGSRRAEKPQPNTREGMIERVAEVLRTSCRKTFGVDWSDHVAAEFARAAIEAMREPTEDMLVEGQKAYAESIIKGHVEGHARIEAKLAAVEPLHLTEGYRAMIDAILSEKP